MLSEQRRHFDALFSANDDPWNYHSTWREQRRFALMLAMLDQPRYASAFEPACATAAFTVLLAERCALVEACDGSAAAVQVARRCTGHLDNVVVSCREIPREWPDRTFDLVVLVDFLYYLTPAEVLATVREAAVSRRNGGSLLVGHWQGTAHDFLTPPPDVHPLVQSVLGRSARHAYQDSDLILELWGPE